MSVIAEFRIPSRDFELGRILHVEGTAALELENLVPVGQTTVPLVWIHNASRGSYLESVREHPAVDDASLVDVFEDRTLFTLDWDSTGDEVFLGIQEHHGQLLSAEGTPESWYMELRFPTHEALAGFRTHCEAAGVSLEAVRVYNPTEPGTDAWYGLSEPQLEALTLAVREGYYDIPRQCSTEDLARELGISDQAVTERLRRAIVALVTDTLDPAD